MKKCKGGTKRKRGICRLYPARLIHLYHTMKENPKKTYILSDFFIGHGSNRLYFTTLIKLGLIEQVSCVYKIGNRHSHNTVKGYRILKK